MIAKLIVMMLISLSMRVLATAKIEAVASEGGETILIQFLKIYRDVVQHIVNRIWLLDDALSEEKLHKMFYEELKRFGFRAHHVSEIRGLGRLLRVLRGIMALNLY